MARFKISDLMIQLPAAEEGNAGVNPATLQPCVRSCPNLSVNLTPFTPCHTLWSCDWRSHIPVTCVAGSCLGARSLVCMRSHIPEDTDWRTVVIDTLSPVIEATVAVDPAEVADLDVLRVQLKKALEKVDEQVRLRDEELAPKTVEEVDQLERRLTDALRELKDHRARLTKA